MCGVASLASATAWQVFFYHLANRSPTLRCVYFPLYSSSIGLTFINTRYSFSHLAIRTASLSPTSIFSRPAAECIRVAMATQSVAPRFPGEASHSWTLYCVSSNTEGLGLSSKAARVRPWPRAGMLDRMYAENSRVDAKSTPRGGCNWRLQADGTLTTVPRGPIYTLTHSSARC